MSAKTPRQYRDTPVDVKLVLYMTSVIVSCIGEPWAYYLLGSFIEVLLLVGIAVTAWRWPAPQTAPAVA